MHFFYLAQLFIIIVVPLIKMALKALGIATVAYIGINLVLGELKDYAIGQFTGNASILLQSIMGLAGLDVALNMYFAAITARLVLSGMNKLNGRKKDFVLKA